MDVSEKLIEELEPYAAVSCEREKADAKCDNCNGNFTGECVCHGDGYVW